LGENVVLAAELDDVPNNKEVTGQLKARDDAQLVFELTSHAGVRFAPALAGTRPGKGAEVAVGGLPRRQGIIGKAIAQVFKGEGAAVGDFARHRERARLIAK
jgi:hypothetical protein